jgi:hypothetical protein
VLDSDRARGAGHARHGQRDGLGGGHTGATTAARARAANSFFMMNSCD